MTAFVLFGLLFFVHGIPFAKTAEESSPEVMTNLPENEAVDRIIPSKPQDLFVVLKNGLTVFVRESHGSKVVSCQVFVRTGSIFEGEYMGAGLSHFLEHVVSGGTTSELEEAEIKERLQAIGGATNAYTSYDRTVYFIDTTGANYRAGLELLMAYVTDCQFKEKEYQREKKVILQEFQLGENNPSRQLWRSFIKTAYRKHPVRYPVIGERDVFLKMDKEDLISHYKRWYTPENVVVVVAGDVDKEEVLDVVLDSANALKRVENPPYVLPAEPRQVSPQRVEKRSPIARLTQALLGFRTITLTDPDLHALDVLAVIMGDGRTSRLYRSLRDDKRLVLSISAGSWTPHFAEGQFTVSMSLSHENLSDAVDAVWNELTDVQTNSVSEEDLQRAKNKVAADYVFELESAQSQAAQLASDWMAAGDPYFSDNYVSKIRDVSREDVRRVAMKYFDKNRMTLAVVGPPALSSDKADLEPISPRQLGGGIQKRILPNQMTLLTKRNPAAPIVSMGFLAKGGLRFEPADKPGLSHFMAGLLTKGTTNRSKLEIAKALEDVGGSIGASSGQNTVGVSVLVLKDDFDTGLDLLADVVLHPSFPESETEKQREDTLLAIKRLDEQWTTEITRLFKRHYYRRHPYRNDVLGKAEAVKGFSEGDIMGFYKSIIKANNAVLAVFGDIEPEVVARDPGTASY
jgi:zinc protease